MKSSLCEFCSWPFFCWFLSSWVTRGNCIFSSRYSVSSFFFSFFFQCQLFSFRGLVHRYFISHLFWSFDHVSLASFHFLFVLTHSLPFSGIISWPWSPPFLSTRHKSSNDIGKRKKIISVAEKGAHWEINTLTFQKSVVLMAVLFSIKMLVFQLFHIIMAILKIWLFIVMGL